MRATIRSLTKSCQTCQTNKKRKLKYGRLPSKTIITVPWRVLCVDLIGSYTLKGKDGKIIDFMAFTMIHPVTSWFEVVELPLVRRLKTITINNKESSIIQEIYDKTSERIVRLVNKRGWVDTQDAVTLFTTIVVNSSWILNTYVKHMVLSVSQLR